MRGLCAWRRRGALATALVTMLAAAWAAPPAEAVSFEEERDMGRKFALAAAARLPLVDDPEIVGYVNRLGAGIVRGLGDSLFEYHFFVVRDANVNAFAVPGGYIYIHSGLLIRVANDDELAAVLAHEIAHINGHHMARQQEAGRLMNYATLLGVLASIVQPAAGAVAIAANAAAQLKYSRDFEQEADYLGARYLKDAGYDPHGMMDFFKKLADEQRTTPTFAPPYLLTHPLTDERLNHLEAVYRTQQWSAHETTPASLKLRWIQALARVRSAAPAEVVSFYRNGVSAAPNDATARFLLGVVCLETGDLETAKRSLEAARAAGVVEAERELGRLALRAREPEQARVLLTRAVEHDATDAGALVELGKSAEALGDGNAALDAYRRAAVAAPSLEAAHYGLGILAGRRGDEAEGFFQLATASRLRGEHEAALKQYTRARVLLPAGDARKDEAQQWMRELSSFLKVRLPEEPPASEATPHG